MCVFQCGAVVRELLASADEPGSTPGDATFSVSLHRFFFFFFSVKSLFFSPIFPFGLFFFFRTADPADHALRSMMYFKL